MDFPREHLKAGGLSREEALRKTLFRGNEPFLRGLCRDSNARQLEDYFTELCVGSRNCSGLWFCANIITELLAFMDNRAVQIERRLARTQVAEKVFDALDYASAERVMVRIEGDPRFGKTESVETWAAMWPGRARVIRTPSSNGEKDLLRAIAEAFGIQHGHSAGGETLKAKVEFVIRFGGLMMIFDEAAFLMPSNFSATTAPARLNWVRTAIVDCKVPYVLVVTPQSYHGAVSRFVKKTGYSIEQFLGREALRVNLPNELPHEDLLAVARIHFPDTDEDLLGLVAAKAMQSESYLKAVENIARRARYNATKRGAKKLTLRDVDLAISEVMPTAPALPVRPAEAPQDRKPRPARVASPAATVLQRPFRAPASSFPAREVVPLNASQEDEAALATG